MPKSYKDSLIPPFFIFYFLVYSQCSSSIERLTCNVSISTNQKRYSPVVECKEINDKDCHKYENATVFSTLQRCIDCTGKVFKI